MSPENERRLIAKLHWSEGLGQFYAHLTATEAVFLFEKHRVQFTSERVVQNAKRFIELGDGQPRIVYFRLPKGHPMIKEIQKR